MPTPTMIENDLAQIEAIVNGAQVPVELLDASEGLSEIPSCMIELTHHQPGTLAMRDVIGTVCAVGIRSRVSNSDPWENRYIHGIVSRLTCLGEVNDPAGNGTKSRYRLNIVPKLWFLTQNRSCRIFQSQSIPDIVTTVLSEYDIAAVWASDEPRGVYPSPEFCVQYNESDFAFISRLMEEYGIFYFFKQSAEEGKMVLADDVRDYDYWSDDDETASTMRFGNAGSGSTGDHIQQWTHDCEFRPHTYAHGDFNDQEATANLRHLGRNSVLSFQNSPANLEVYEYPGGFTGRAGAGRHFEDLTLGENLADRRIQEQEAAQEVIRGSGISPSFAPGTKFVLLNHPVTSENSTYVVRAVRMTSRTDAGQPLPSGAAVRSEFVCLPATVCFRASRTTPRPIVRGPQTAVVTNSDGSVGNTADAGSLADTNTDAAGRVRVRFHWDQTTSATSSCWVRVSQSWAGPGYGSLMLPYVGHEVVVSFLEGDPDRPLITGRVYNSENLPPREEDEVAVNPHRVVVAQDEVGNTIILDGDEGRVDVQNASDKFELTVGTSATATAGMDGCDPVLRTDSW